MRTLLCLLLTCLTSFGAGYRIRDLPNTNTIGGAEVFELDDGTKSWKVTGANLWKAMGTNNQATIINISTNIANYSYATNLFATNFYAYSTTEYISYVTNLYSTTNFSSYSYVTNLYDQRAFISTNYSTNLYSTTAYFTTNYSTNLYSTQAYFTTNYSTNLYSTTAYFTTNYNDYSVTTNLYSTTQVTSNLYATNIYVNYLVASNLLVLESTNNLAAAASNIVVNMDMAGLEVTVTNNITLTNFTGLANGTTKTRVVFLQVTVGGPWSVVYPSDGASYGVYWATNCLPQANRPYTSLTNGSTYVLSLTSRGTNLYSAMTEWK